MPLSSEIRAVVAELDAVASGHPRGDIAGHHWEVASANLLAIALRLREREMEEAARDTAPRVSNVIPLVRL
ncbi:MAG: hypothetical protein CMO30_06355 [Tistrella sp.]|uniref:hypothetical protein n=1 Tax=Tistrella sp. TaxID=2024861 RepID=UPI000C441380|nr:hypothetical protein [Tistrella sp.]MAD39546.1 hypothetical protein [Tistrella sp.]MBA74891.1 hypothetical protein [Tistrella sp.]